MVFTEDPERKSTKKKKMLSFVLRFSLPSPTTTNFCGHLWASSVALVLEQALLTPGLFALAPALGSRVQRHLLDNLQLLFNPWEVEVCAFLANCGKI